MPRIDLVLALIRAGSSGDAAGVRSAVDAIANEEAKRGHNVAAERVRNAMQPTVFQPMEAMASRPDLTEGLLIALPARQGLESLVLEERAKADLLSLVREQKQTKKLHAEGLLPRHRVLLSGPPGNGKTSVAEALAHDLRVPFSVVSYGALIGSLLGETARRIDALFAEASTKPCVLFFDEFEALGKERADRQETGEMKRVLASLLTRIDSLPSSVVVVAATNHPEMLDRAVWRRFEIKVTLNPPNYSQVISYLIQQMQPDSDLPLIQLIGQCFSTTSYAELRDFSLDVKRRAVLDGTSYQDALRQEISIRFPEIDWPFDDDRSKQAAAEAQSTKKLGTTDGKTARNTRQ